MGDFHQLPPIGDQWIFNQTRIYGWCNAIATNICRVYFKIYKLTKHIRPETDKVYSWLQEEISVGKVSANMLPHLKKNAKQKKTMNGTKMVGRS